MKILLATDGSSASTRALRFLIRHQVRSEGARLTLIHVDAPLNGHVASYLDEPAIHGYHARNAAAAMRHARRILASENIDHEELLTTGDAAEEIAIAARRGKFDMVAMGSHGRGAVGSAFLGSVVRKVLERSKIPILVVR
jgi:nucleotide-binding universal stress UspA family protein